MTVQYLVMSLYSYKPHFDLTNMLNSTLFVFQTLDLEASTFSLGYMYKNKTNWVKLLIYIDLCQPKSIAPGLGCSEPNKGKILI